MSTKIKVLSVCGSGVVTSHMVANKIVDMFADEGYDVDAEECNHSELDGYLMRGSYDFIAYSSPIGDPHGTPAFSAMGLITGLGEDEFMEQALACLHEAGKEKEEQGKKKYERRR